MTAPVSVVIPTFQRHGALAQTLDVLRQCRPAPCEILVMVDHGDQTTRPSLEAQYPEVQWLEATERVGPGGGRAREGGPPPSPPAARALRPPASGGPGRCASSGAGAS